MRIDRKMLSLREKPGLSQFHFVHQNISYKLCWKRTRPSLWETWFMETPYLSLRTILTLILLTWRLWWAPNNASKWQMGFNSAFKKLISNSYLQVYFPCTYSCWIYTCKYPSAMSATGTVNSNFWLDLPNSIRRRLYILWSSSDLSHLEYYGVSFAKRVMCPKTRCNISEDFNLQQHSREIIKSRMKFLTMQFPESTLLLPLPYEGLSKHCTHLLFLKPVMLCSSLE